MPETTYIGGKEKALPLKEIINRLENVYCKSIGAEYMHINNLDQINWIRERLETPGALELETVEKRLLLARISRAIGFEAFLAKKWTAEKRFGLEGVEMLIPCMKQVMPSYVCTVFVIMMIRSLTSLQSLEWSAW